MSVQILILVWKAAETHSRVHIQEGCGSNCEGKGEFDSLEHMYTLMITRNKYWIEVILIFVYSTWHCHRNEFRSLAERFSPKYSAGSVLFQTHIHDNEICNKVRVLNMPTHVSAMALAGLNWLSRMFWMCNEVKMQQALIEWCNCYVELYWATRTGNMLESMQNEAVETGWRIWYTQIWSWNCGYYFNTS